MSHRNSRSHNTIYVREKHVLEPEANCQKRFVRRAQSGHKIRKSNLSLRKCESAHGPSKKTRRRRRRIRRRLLTTKNLKVPRLPDRIVNFLNILHQENFPKVVDQYFKTTAKNELQKQPRRKRIRVKTTNSVCKPGVPTPADFKL